MTIGQIIKEYREAHGLSQRQFAILSGFSNGYISILENNENPRTGQPMVPSLLALKKIATTMGMSLQSLLEQLDDMEISLDDVLENISTPTVVHDERTDEFIRMFEKLDSKMQIMVIRMLKDLSDSQ